MSALFFFSSRRRHTRWPRDWSSDVCSSDLQEGDNFRNLLLDVALLRSLRIGVALVHGAGHQVRKLAEQTGQTPSNIDGAGVTDAATLQLAIAAATRVTHEMLEGLSATDLRGAATNALVAHPAGILQGVDHLWTGK